MSRSTDSPEPLFKRGDGALMVREGDGRSRLATVSETAEWSAPKPSWWRRRASRRREPR